MSKAGSATKVKLSSYDDLFGSVEENAGSEEQIIRVKLTELHEFRNHPFRVLNDEKMEETADSISKYGVLVPGIARPRAEGGYEIIAGHRRKRGSERAGKEDMPVIVRNYTDDEATIIMVDSNIPVSYTHLDVYKRQVLAILITAPLGALGMDGTYRLLLKKE